MCVCGIKGSKGWVQVNSLEKRAVDLTCNMGLEWREVHILTVKATMPCKGFWLLKTHTIYYRILPYCINTIYFAPLQVKTNQCDLVYKCAFILGSVSMVSGKAVLSMTSNSPKHLCMQR
jgi:hypothetical protein